MKKARPGFPEPLVDFEDPEDVARLRAEAFEKGYMDLTTYLVGEAPLGPLREADPILGDLVVSAQSALGAVLNRLADILPEAPDAQR